MDIFIASPRRSKGVRRPAVAAAGRLPAFIALLGRSPTPRPSEEVQREPVRLANAEAPMTPRLSRQVLLDRKALLNGSPVCLFHVFDLDHHESALWGPVIPKVER